MIIGIGGLCAGAGATHTALLTAGFLKTFGRKKVVLLEKNENNNLQSFVLGKRKNNSKQNSICGISIAGNEGITEPAYYRETGYQCCVVDYGICWRKERYHFLHSDLRILVGGGAFWQENRWKSTINWMEENQLTFDAFQFLVNQSFRSVDYLQSLISAKLYYLGFEPKPLQPSATTIQVLQKLLSSCTVTS